MTAAALCRLERFRYRSFARKAIAPGPAVSRVPTRETLDPRIADDLATEALGDLARL